MTEEEKTAPETAEATQVPAELPAAAEPAGSAGRETLRQELEQAQAKVAEYLDGWQRARAELANARKRFQRDQEQAYTNSQCDVLARLLPVVDDLERAFETLPHNLSGLTWIQGVALIQRKLQFLLEQAGVTPIDAVGKPFDPFVHEAVTHEPSDTEPAGQVISELQKGYRLGERVLRPAMVRVSSGSRIETEKPPEAPEEEVPAAGDGTATGE